MDAAEDRESDLPDLSRVNVADLQGLPDDALTAALRRMLSEIDAADEPVAGFQSAI